MRIVGLTGGIASGKSTVSCELQQLGLPVIDCDGIAHDVVGKGKWGYRRIVSAFGSHILQPNGEIDCQALGDLAFSSTSARKQLNNATHLPVLVELLYQVLKHWLCFQWVVVVDMPLLLETGAHNFTSPVVLVACSPDVQLQRLMARDGSSREAAAARIAAQMPLERKLALADVVIRNDGSVEELKQEVRQVAARIRNGSGWKGWCSSPLLLIVIAGAGVAALRARW